MLNRLPIQMPPLEMMLDDIGNPTAHELGRALGVTTRAVERWRNAGTAPRPVLLAVFWLTRWGMSIVDCEAENAARLHISMAACLRTEIRAQSAQLAQLGRIADFGSANDPASGVALPSAGPGLQTAPSDAPIRPRRATAQLTAEATTRKTQQPRRLRRG